MLNPQNIIYTGVAGTGKTYRLQQLAKKYSEEVAPINKIQLLATMVEPLSWREVICLVFLEQRQQSKELLKVPEILSHKFFLAKVNLTQREENLSQTVWGNLQKHASHTSKTVKYSKKSSQAYFDKDETSSWYLLDDALPVLKDLHNLLVDYNQSVQQAQNNKQITARYSMVSFHQAYGYDEFVEGIRPLIDNQTGQMRYEVQAGAFIRLCEQAKQDPNHRYAMLIDEINRANVSQVFGELMSLIEPSKRAGQPNAMSVNLAYSHKPFSVPSNVDIYATMNTQDHSLTALDSAFRRRFEFIEMLPNSAILGHINDINGNTIYLGKLLDGLNNKIVQTLGEQARLGHAYFYGINNISGLINVMAKQVIPQIISQASHQPHALVDIFELQNTKTPWLVPLTNEQANSNQTIQPQFGLGGMESMNHQSSYMLNPKVLNMLEDKLDNHDFAVVEAFEGLY